MRNPFCYLKICALLVGLSSAQAQMRQPVKWNFSSVPAKGNKIEIVFTAAIEEGWHIYIQNLKEGGPMPTIFTFDPSPGYSLIEGVKENSIPIEKFDQTFLMPVSWFEETAVFTQIVNLNETSTVIKGRVEFMACSEYECLLPESKEFAIEVKATKSDKKIEKPTPTENTTKQKQDAQSFHSSSKLETKVSSASPLLDSSSVIKSEENHLAGNDIPADPGKEEKKIVVSPTHEVSTAGLLEVFGMGLLAGLAALLMPCIFPMIPFAVGFFLKRGGSRKEQVFSALIYGLSIIVIYVSLGAIVTLFFGADSLNDLSTNGIFNTILFLLLVVFAASFLGAFEISLPAKWSTKVDAQSDRKGFAGIFFMAATLAIVSFSCTGPLIGTLLVSTFKMGSSDARALIGMLGFSLAVALPFTIFALFPSWLKALPKSGGWLNSIKVILGFLELALALKFLSNADLAYHWNFLDREVFLVLWIIIFSMMGFYLLGKIKLPHDSKLEYLSPIRLLLAITTLAFALYMIPGLWGAPLRVISAFLPPQQTQDFDLYSKTLSDQRFVTNFRHPRKYDNLFEAPYNLNAFFDFDEGIAYAERVNKPVFIDFTGHACVNCRKMEMTVWSDPDVLKKLREDYVLIQLYVDDKTELAEAEQRISSFSGKKLLTIGNKWSDLQASQFNTNSQPYYVLLDHQTKRQLVPAQGADYDAERFELFLSEGVKAFYMQ